MRVVAVFSNFSERDLVQARIGKYGEMNSLLNGAGASYVPGWPPLSVVEVIDFQWRTKVVQRIKTPLSFQLRGVFYYERMTKQCESMPKMNATIYKLFLIN